MFDYFKKKREEKQRLKDAYEVGQKFGEDIGNALAAYLEPRLETVSVRLIEVFRGQMTKIYGEELPPAEMVRIQFNIFMDEVTKFKQSMREEVESARHDVYEYAEAAQCRDLAETFTRERVSRVAEDMIVEATSIAVETIEQLPQATPKGEDESDVDGLDDFDFTTLDEDDDSEEKPDLADRQRAKVKNFFKGIEELFEGLVHIAYVLGAWVVGICVFAWAWYSMVQAYGFFAILLGWIPAGVAGAIAGALWPLGAAFILWLWSKNGS